MVPGSFYLMRRKCGKPSCRCARGQLHPAWVLTRSEAGRHKLYAVRPEQRGTLRPLAQAYRRHHRARARLVKQAAQLLALVDALAQTRIVPWPPPPKKPGP